MNDTLVRRSIVSKCLARFLSSLRQVNSESLENINKENYHFQVAESLTSTFQQIKTNLELRKRNLITSSKDKWVNQLCTDYDSHLPSSTPVTSYQINSTINGNQINNNSTDFEPGSLIKSKYEPNRTVEPSSSYTSNNTLDSVASFNTSLVTSFNASDSSDSNSTSIHQSIDSGFSAIQLSNQNKAQNRNHKIQNLICKKDEQAFISNLLYFLNLKNENDSNENSLTSNSRSDNLPEHIALSLVKVFSTTEKSFQIDPNELDCWLISEEEVPQKLLPIPNVQFLTQHFNQATNSLISELDENEIDSTMSYQQISCSESNPIDIQTNSLESASIRDNLTDNRTGATDDDQLIENERKLLNNTDLLNSNLSTKPMLTHEQDEMQKLNTLFNSGKFFNFSSLNNSVKYRGSDHWSPPRAMIHVVIHPAPKRQELIAKQNYLCCGCGLRIEKQEIPRMLYCYYTGKYFCKYGCHSQTKTIIPAYVINKWSFKLFPVSNFAFQVIQNNYTKPLFNIQDLNPKLFAKVKQFQNLHDMRGQLLKLKDYILTCKKAANLLVVYLMFEPKHFVESSKDLTYSLEDLVDLKKDCTTLERVFDLVSESIKHIKKCSNCLAKGFICELCSNSNQTARQSTGSRQGMMDVLFPFEIGRVKQCEACFTCFHLNCFAANNFKCVKCVRIERRKSSLLQQEAASEVAF